MPEGGHRLLGVLVWMPFRRTLASICFWPMRCERLYHAKAGWLATFVDLQGEWWDTNSISRVWRRRL